MKEVVAIRQRPLMLCKWCGHPSGPGPACGVCGSPLDLRLHGGRAFSEDLFSHQRLLRPARTEASQRPGLEAPLESQPKGQDREPREAPARSEIVVSCSPRPLEVAGDSRSEPLAGSGPLLVLESGRWWSASPAPGARAALRRETGRTWVTRIATFLGSVWALDFLVSHV